MGTHPIFESDFDCLTEIVDKCRSIMNIFNQYYHNSYDNYEVDSTVVAPHISAFFREARCYICKENIGQEQDAAQLTIKNPASIFPTSTMIKCHIDCAICYRPPGTSNQICFQDPKTLYDGLLFCKQNSNENQSCLQRYNLFKANSASRPYNINHIKTVKSFRKTMEAREDAERESSALAQNSSNQPDAVGTSFTKKNNGQKHNVLNEDQEVTSYDRERMKDYEEDIIHAKRTNR